MRSRALIALTAMSGALVTGGWLLQRGLQRTNDASADARLFDAVLDHVARDYVDSIPVGTLYDKATAGMVDELHDPYSAYLTGDRLRRLNETTSGTYAGLGVQIDLRDDWITIIAPVPGTPAERAGIQAGDRILAVDGRSTEGWTMDEASHALRGPAGSRVSLLVERPGVAAHLPFTVVRSNIHIGSVRHAMMLTDRIGYVDFTVFSESSADELRNAIASLRRQGMKTLLLDLRSNPGGLLEQGVGVADMFLDAGQRIVAIRGRSAGASHEFTDETRQLWPDLDLVTLVDDHTASAAEIVAGALQDHDRSVIVGATTYGKGVAQSVFPLSGSGMLKLTTARWFTPAGRSIQKPRPDTAADDGADDGTDADTAVEKPLSERARYRTDDGRVVYGGGGITPDVIVSGADTANEMLDFWRLLGPDIPRFRDALTDYAVSLKGTTRVTSRSFEVTPAMRVDLWKRLQAKGVHLDRQQYDAAAGPVSQLLGDEIARYVFGTDAAFRRQLHDDRVITAALQLATGATTEAELLRRAADRRAAKREDVGHTTP